MGAVDTVLNSADLSTEFHSRRRRDELLMMLPLKIGVGLETTLGAEEHRTEDANGEYRDGSLASSPNTPGWSS